MFLKTADIIGIIIYTFSHCFLFINEDMDLPILVRLNAGGLPPLSHRVKMLPRVNTPAFYTHECFIMPRH